MKNLLTVLKKLGNKMTGDDISGTNLVTVVDDIAEKYTGGSGGGEGDSGDRGWGYESTQLFSETVTTEDMGGVNYGSLTYASLIDSPAVIVTFDGTSYTCVATENEGTYLYGAPMGEQGPDFSDFPFLLESTTDGNNLYIETAGTHTIAAVGNVIVTSADFSAAVGKCLPILKVELGKTTFQKVENAIIDGLFVYGWDDDNGRMFYALSTGEDAGTSKYYLVVLTQGIGTTNLTTEIFFASSLNSPLYAE